MGYGLIMRIRLYIIMGETEFLKERSGRGTWEVRERSLTNHYKELIGIKSQKL